MPLRSLAPVISAALLTALLPGRFLAGQQHKVVPSGMDNVEGPSVYTYPFGRVDAGMYLLCDADQVTTALGIVNGLSFRASQQTTSSAGYTKPYRVTAFVVAANAAAMAALASPFDPNNVLNGATGTVVFQGPLTLPSIGPLAVAPAAFNISIPFASPFVFDGSQGNLLLLVETTDTTAVSGTYRVDAVQFRSTVIEGIAAAIDAGGCAAGGATLAIATADASVVVGSAIDTTVTASAAGAFSLAFAALGLDRADLDLAPLGLPGCTSRLGSSFVLQALVPAGSFPHALWPIPASPAYVGIQLFTQGIAVPAAGAGIAVSNAQALRLGSNALPVIHAQSAFRVGGQWFQSTTGALMPVVQLDGVFP
jgi:hypothetical protein